MGHPEAGLISPRRAEPPDLAPLGLDVLVTEPTDPERNLALEDELLAEVEAGLRRDTLRLWVNDECLVRGPHRSRRSGWHRPEAARRLGVPVLTRSTGGGSVYHDRGNLNWSFYLQRTVGYVGAGPWFRACAALIIDALAVLDLGGSFVPPNRIDVDGRKISGLASRASLGAVLVHGTLLVSTDLERLNALCIPPPGCPPVALLRHFRPGLTVPDVARAIRSAVGDQRRT